MLIFAEYSLNICVWNARLICPCVVKLIAELRLTWLVFNNRVISRYRYCLSASATSPY